MRTDRPIVQSLEPRRLLAADLRAGFALLSAEIVGEDFPIQIRARLRNDGDAATPGSVAWRAILASDDAGTRDVVVLGNGTRPAIAGGGVEDEFDLTFAVPTSALGTLRNLILTIDPDDAVAESDETNNSGVREITLADTIPTSGILLASDGDDKILMAYVDGALVAYGVADGGEANALIGTPADYARLIVDLRGGDDFFVAQGIEIPVDAFGNDGDDTIRGGLGADTIDGGAGNDRIDGLSVENGDRIDGDVGNDTIVGYFGNDTIDGGDGDDLVYGQAGDDSILGDAGDDVVDAGGGGDTVDGGDGDDYVRGDGDGTVDVELPTVGTETVPGADFLRGDDGRDTLHGDEGDDTLNGNAGGDSLNGGVGDDLLQGNGGRDKIRGAAGLDRLYGGPGDDFLDGRDAGQRDILSGREGRDTGYFDGLDFSSSIEETLR